MPPRSPWSSPEDLVGQMLDQRYRVVRLLGEGGMGVVYEALHVRLGKRVAVKVLHPHLAMKERLGKRFLREARAANRIASPHVVEILDFGDDPITYFVMEFLPGRDLKEVIREHGKLAWPRARHLVLQILRALAAAHDAGVVHRDVKPANVFVVRDEEGRDFAKVLDFGIAKVEKSSPQTRSITRTAEIIGSVAYMSPEQATGVVVDARTDVYSAAVLFFEMLTGQIPFKGGNNYQLIDGHVRRAPPKPRSLVPSIPEQVESIILRGLQKKPSGRFDTMRSFIAAVEAVPPEAKAIGEAPAPPDSLPQDEDSSPSMKLAAVPVAAPKRQRLWIGFAVGAAIAIGVGAFVASSPVEPSAPETTQAPARQTDGSRVAEVVAAPKAPEAPPERTPIADVQASVADDVSVPDVPEPQVDEPPVPPPKSVSQPARPAAPRRPKRDSSVLRRISKTAAAKCSPRAPVSVTFQVMHTGKTFLVKTQPKNDCVAKIVGAAKFRERAKPERKSLTVG